MIPLERLRDRALSLGFCAVGAAEARPGDEGRRLEAFLADGRHASMSWMAREPERRADPRRILAGVRSVLVVASAVPADDRDWRGPGTIARYARLADYHDAMLPRLQQLASELDDPQARAHVDTGPVMEKVWARRAGIGWVGPQTHLVTRRHGCWTLLGVVLTRAEIETGEPHVDRCGRCTRCLEACPTGAVRVDRPGEIDARLCRSYLTIEHRGALPLQARPLLGDALFGCDLCLDACPWNRFAGGLEDPDLELLLPGRLDPAEILAMNGTVFRRRFARTPVLRARRRGLLRNAAVVLGNLADRAAMPTLNRCLAAEADPVVREHAGWALQRLVEG